MAIETLASPLVQQLQQAGLRPKEQLVKQILAQGVAARPDLVALAVRFELLHDEEPECYGPLHALRLLGELGDPAAVAPLLEALPVPVYEPDEETGYVDIPATLWGSEIVQIIAHCGPDIEATLWAWADDGSHSDVSRGAAMQAIAYVATLHGTREQVIAEARRRLEVDADSSPMMFSGLINMLADLGDKPSYSAVMAAYRQGRVDQSRMPAAIARQLLLSGGRRELACVKHSLWERYEQHGPKPEQQLS